jgi:hypothetical protein
MIFMFAMKCLLHFDIHNFRRIHIPLSSNVKGTSRFTVPVLPVPEIMRILVQIFDCKWIEHISNTPSSLVSNILNTVTSTSSNTALALLPTSFFRFMAENVHTFAQYIMYGLDARSTCDFDGSCIGKQDRMHRRTEEIRDHCIIALITTEQVYKQIFVCI